MRLQVIENFISQQRYQTYLVKSIVIFVKRVSYDIKLYLYMRDI